MIWCIVFLLFVLAVLSYLLVKVQWQMRKLEKQLRFVQDKQSDGFLVCDIRTPLTSLDGYFQLLEDTEDVQERTRYLQIIQERIHALRDMLEELFTYTKLESRNYEVSLTKCDFGALVKEALFSYYDEWKKQQMEPQLQLEEGALWVLGNDQAMRRVLQNIIKNVWEHGGRHVKICLSKQENQACLIVQNEVLHPEYIDVDRIFERFYKADLARSTTSSGLGMAIAHQLVEQMNGQITADLQGNIFSIYLRLACVRS